MNSVIEISNVFKSFKSLTAVNDVSLNIYEGEYIALLGPNGAGKTTLIEMIEGIQKPDKGEIHILGKNWMDHELELHQQLGIALQETKFIDKLKTDETVELFASFYGLPISRVNEVLDLVNLNEKRTTYVNNLSGGQRQRLALAIALLNGPKIILLDEPTTGLDPTSRREIWNILQDLKKHGTTMILTTHYMEEAQVLCDRILIMDKGNFIAEGTLPELTSKYGEGDIIQFTLDKNLSDDLNKVAGYKNIHWLEPGKRGKMVVENLAISVPSFMNFIAASDCNFLELECRKMTLDDLFIYMTGRNLYE